ncbi:hypothetical protein [Psychroserpens sp.]|uniref:hypothetical protein n=1 Tax=Psychroserpens sp. TaxID=2020870 RepID=UPI001B1DA602|nr:hypothetical protein [Psychroserpens sp.]MBO6606116.1 hypothetical protein [Psychroserpens sp.]MBO6630624.1 hypothetical protein [Psychroserpens sp.]MBO6652513.1 hypothetical protein [Psychroserpens sp.]MBO6681715.1 hypothetical protein [Psychroserpens sp.]MBO6749490.1 hypothetical protein [Psychroserpens sp.]
MSRLLPTFGILIFVLLYIYAAAIYPGGSPADPNSIGFDWFQNLWCNLMEEKAINGQDNPARTVSLFAIVVLGLSMTIFFFLFAKYFEKHTIWKRVIVITGVLSMVSAAFIFTSYHDIMTTILSLSGLIGISSILRALYKNKMPLFIIGGIICVVLIGLNNLFYYNQNYGDYLAIIQQLDFIAVLSWTVGLNLKMLNKKELS